jgi:regulatory protein
LSRDGFDKDQVDETVARLKERRFLDDAGFAERYARSRIQHQGHGRNRLRAALRAKGVRAATVEAGLKEALEQVSEADALDKVARQYWKNKTRDDPQRKLRNLWGFLLRRGFPATLVVTRLRTLWPRWQDALDGLDPAEAEAVDDVED